MLLGIACYLKDTRLRIGYQDEAESKSSNASICVRVQDLQEAVEILQRIAWGPQHPIRKAFVTTSSKPPSPPFQATPHEASQSKLCIAPPQTSGPALITSSVASSLYFLKFSTKSPPSFVTSSLKSAVPVQLFFGLSNSSGTPGQVFGTLKLNVS